MYKINYLFICVCFLCFSIPVLAQHEKHNKSITLLFLETKQKIYLENIDISQITFHTPSNQKIWKDTVTSNNRVDIYIQGNSEIKFNRINIISENHHLLINHHPINSKNTVIDNHGTITENAYIKDYE